MRKTRHDWRHEHDGLRVLPGSGPRSSDRAAQANWTEPPSCAPLPPPGISGCRASQTLWERASSSPAQLLDAQPISCKIWQINMKFRQILANCRGPSLPKIDKCCKI